MEKNNGKKESNGNNNNNLKNKIKDKPKISSSRVKKPRITKHKNTDNDKEENQVDKQKLKEKEKDDHPVKKIDLKIQLKPRQKWNGKRKPPVEMNLDEYQQLMYCRCLQWSIPNMTMHDILTLSNVCWEMRIFVWEKFKMIWLAPQKGISLYPHQIESLMWMRTCEMDDRETEGDQNSQRLSFKKGEGLVRKKDNREDDNSDSDEVESDSDQDEVSLNKYNSAVVDEPGKLGWRGMRGGILSLRMGLGKTITATSLCLMEAKDPVNKLPNLVVVPKTLILEWKFHFEQFYGERVKVLYYHRDYLSDRQMQSLELWELQQYDFIVTSYDFIRGVSNRYELWKFVVEWTEMGKRRKVNIRSRPNWEDVRWGQFSGPMLLFMVPWRRIICDESQHFANPTTSLFEAMCALYADHKWCLTGTPMKNQMKDIWAQLRWCGLDFSFKYNRPPHGIGRGKIPTPWTEAMVKKYKNYIATYGLGYHIDIQRFDIDRHNRWKPWMYRGFDVDDRILQYEYKDTNIRLPSLNEVRVPVNLTNEEWEIYQEVFDQTVKTYQGYMSGGNKRLSRTSSTGITYANVLAKFTRLRQICIAPHLITLESKREAVAGKLQIDQELKKKLNEMTDGRENKLRNPKSNYGIFSTKINKTLHIIDSVLNDNQNHTSTSTSTSSSISGPNERLNKVLVFTNFLGAIDLLKLALRERMGISKVLVLDGASKDRGAIVKKFQEDDSFRILILNYAVGAQGLNLTAGNHVILMNQWWCPMVHKQAVARAWRIGQNRSVKVYKLIAEKTIEETMIEKYNNAKIQQIDDLYDGHEVKLDKYVMGPILGINGSSCINIGGY